MTRRKKHDLGVVKGDVYAGPLADGRYGAVHVIDWMKDGMRPGRDSVTLVCTRYLGAAPPALDDPALRQVLRQHRFRYRGEPAIMIADVPPPGTFVHVGTFPPTEEELSLDPRGTYGSGWRVIDNVRFEWRWEHDRDAFEREQQIDAADIPARVQPVGPRPRTPRSTLTEDDFWALIATLDAATAAPDADLDPAPLVAGLRRRTAADIREFDEVLAHKLYLLDARRFADHAGTAGQSDDAFLYARCHVVARGRACHEDVLAHPEHFPAESDFEALLEVASEAFLARTGKDYEHDTHFSYETGSNQDGWP